MTAFKALKEGPAAGMSDPGGPGGHPCWKYGKHGNHSDTWFNTRFLDFVELGRALLLVARSTGTAKICSYRKAGLPT